MQPPLLATGKLESQGPTPPTAWRRNPSWLPSNSCHFTLLLLSLVHLEKLVEQVTHIGSFIVFVFQLISITGKSKKTILVRCTLMDAFFNLYILLHGTWHVIRYSSIYCSSPICFFQLFQGSLYLYIYIAIPNNVPLFGEIPQNYHNTYLLFVWCPPKLAPIFHAPWNFWKKIPSKYTDIGPIGAVTWYHYI